jgi:hypothetical protein
MAVSHVTPPHASPRAGERAHRELSPRTQALAEKPAEKRGPGAALLLLALPVLCCGGPAIFAALAAASAATLGVVGGVFGAVLLPIALGLWVRHRRRAACCAPAQKAWRP